MPASAPTSRPTLSGLFTSSPTISMSGRAVTAAIADLADVPAPPLHHLDRHADNVREIERRPEQPVDDRHPRRRGHTGADGRHRSRCSTRDRMPSWLARSRVRGPRERGRDAVVDRGWARQLDSSGAVLRRGAAGRVATAVGRSRQAPGGCRSDRPSGGCHPGMVRERRLPLSSHPRGVRTGRTAGGAGPGDGTGTGRHDPGHDDVGALEDATSVGPARRTPRPLARARPVSLPHRWQVGRLGRPPLGSRSDHRDGDTRQRSASRARPGRGVAPGVA